MKIDVKDKKGMEDITIILKDISFSVDAIGEPNIMFWLTPDEADKLSFQLQSVLQDRERRKKK